MVLKRPAGMRKTKQFYFKRNFRIQKNDLYNPSARMLLLLFIILMSLTARAQCPSVTVGTNPTICAGSFSATLPISGLAGGMVNSVTTTFNYTGAIQNYSVPGGVTALTIDLSGAAGQNSLFPGGSPGGLGGRVQGVLSVTAGEVLNIYVGGQYTWNGGGAAAYDGGDASDIRIGGNALTNRVMVGGGGGGGSDVASYGGAGGNLTGGDGQYFLCAGGGGGTQVTGGAASPCAPSGTAGSLGLGGWGAPFDGGGGGGGGYYGGGSGSGLDGPGSGIGGGGGSSYSDAGLVSGVSMTQGYNPTLGYVTITSVAIQYTYGIVWSSAAAAAGFTNVTGLPLYGTTSSISIPAPANAPVAVYTGTLTLSNGSCSSPGYVISINVAPAVTLGSNPSICAGVTSAAIPFSYGGCPLVDTVQTTFNYTGAVQTYTVPVGVVTLNIDLSGASGNNSHYPGGTNGGLGGRVKGTLSVTSGEVLNIYVGGQSEWNGGGDGGFPGGDATDIRIGGTSFANRVMVAGGGGGGSDNPSYGGAGGDTVAGNAQGDGCNGGFGATQTAGGAPSNCGGTPIAGYLGQGGYATSGVGGGGGGGYYGGGGGYDLGGGGGSSFTDPILISGVSMTQGYNEGLGYVSLSGLSTPVYTYNIVWSSAAITAGFSNVTGASLSGSAINISTPGGAAAAVYTATVTITHGVSNVNYPVSVTIISAPSSINGTTGICTSSPTTLTDAATGGTWSSSNTGIVTIGSVTGTVNGVSVGSTTISYSTGCGAAVGTVVTVSGLPSAGTITGASAVTVGSNITLTDVTGIGSWNAGNSNATVSGGVVTGVAAGTVTISYAVTGSCGTAYAQKVITVTNPAGPGGLCVGNTTTLTGTPSGGTWSSSNGGVATVGSTGIVMATGAGTATIIYTVGSTHTTQVVTVNANPLPIQGVISECVGTTITLSDNTPGGTWSSTGDVSVSGGVVTAGATAGTGTITYTLGSGCFITYPNTVIKNPSPIFGLFTICVGSTAILSDSSATGVSWTSSNPSVASAPVNSGHVLGVTAGTAIITYKALPGNCIATQIVTVTSTPAPINGNSPVCAGATLSLSDAVGAGAWTSSNTAAGTVNASTGVVTGIAGGTTTIVYTSNSVSCTSSAIVTVNAILPITGSTGVCSGGTTTLYDASGGGTWTSGNAGIATIGSSTGVVAGVATGSALITYTLASGCMRITTVNASGAINPITGTTALCVSATTTLNDITVGGKWSISNALVASIGSGTGFVTAGANAGTATIYYTAGTCVASSVLAVNAVPKPIHGATSMCAGTVVSLSDTTSGGVWASNNTNATIAGAGSTISVTGSAAGSSTITFTLGNGCYTTYPILINKNPSPILGNLTVCQGLTTTLSDTSNTSVSWTSSNTLVATVGASGVVTGGTTTGMATIAYKVLPGNCITTVVVTVNAVPVVNAIAGPASIAEGAPQTLTETTPGGIWSSSNTAKIALSGSAGLTVTATALALSGSSVISYAVTSGGCTTTKTLTITSTNPPPHGGSTGVEPLPVQMGAVSLYPNPSNGAINIRADVAGVFYLYSLDGKALGSYKIGEGITSVTLPNEVATGIYMGRYVGEDGSVTLFKVVKE